MSDQVFETNGHYYGITRSAQRAAALLESHQLPSSDNIPFKASHLQFEGGGYYGVEIPVINNLRTLEVTIDELKKNGTYCTRFDETQGSLLLSDSELSEMLSACAENGYGLVVGLGPRPEYDIKASFARSSFGLEQARHVNNNDAIAASLEEALRLVDLGCQGLTVYDPGILKLLNLFRQQHLLPLDLKLKTSSHCMATNPFIAQLFAENGADSITTAHDLGLPVLQEMRRLCPSLILDIPIDVYKSKGGFVRFYEMAELVQIASPLFLKMGASAQGHPYDKVGDETTRERVRRVGLGLEYLAKTLPEAKPLSSNHPFACIPKRSHHGKTASSPVKRG
jgi:hypothetical protein